MGEGKRRARQDPDPNARLIPPNTPEVRALLGKGQPLNVHLFGAAAIIAIVYSKTFDELMVPELHALRLAFQTLDRIRTGEIEPWCCFLCNVGYADVAAVSVMAVIERALGDPTPKKPGIVAPICHACDGVSTEHTRRRVNEALGLYGLQEGHA
jgi:hypothetical protein